MGFTYKIYDQQGIYYITCTVHQWVDIFTRKIYVDILIDSLKHCQMHKGLEIYAWVIMSNHCHLIISSKKNNLSDIIRDFKKFTAKQIVSCIENNLYESRRDWLLWLLKKDGHIWFWQEGYHAKEILKKEFYLNKMDYIHLNPVRTGLVEKEEDYNWSSCADSYGVRKGLLELSDLLNK
jgi:putative transposase